jgi:hypothetical protein
MVFHRARVARIIAAILTIALSTQVVTAQVVSCSTMSTSQGESDHSAMMKHQHDAADAGSAVTGGGTSHQQDLRAATCAQAILCLNTPAIPVAAIRAITGDHALLPVSVTPSAFEQLALSPDSPPPRI